MSDGSVTIDARLALDELKRDLKNLKSTINSSLPSASKMLDSLGTGFEKLGKTVTSVGKACSVVTAGIIAGLSSAVGRFDTLNNYPKVLGNLGFSAEEAEKSIEDLSKGIDGLPTALDDAASGVQRLVAKNNDIEKSTRYFLAMNDAIVAGNAPTEQQKSAIEQLTQAYSKGKPDLMEWRTLMMAMPGQLKQVATAMGYIDTDALYQALNKGTISMDTFMDALVELDKNGADGIMSFQEQAKNSCDSIGTAITNVSNRFKKGFATILSSMNEAAKDTAFGSLAGMINNFSNSIKNFLDRIGNAIKENEAFKSFMNEIASNLTKLSETINNLSDEQLNAIITAIINIAKAGPKLLILGKVFTIVGGILKGFSGSIETFNSIHKTITNVANAFKVLKEAGTFANIATNALKLLKVALSAICTPIGGTIVIISVLVGIFALLWVKCEWFRNFWINLWEIVKKGIGQAKEFVCQKIQDIADLFTKLSDKFNSIKQSVSDFANNFISIITGLASKAGNNISKLWNDIKTKFSNGINNVITKVKEIPNKIVKILKSIESKVKGVFESIKEWFTRPLYEIGYDIGYALMYIPGLFFKLGVLIGNWAKQNLPIIINNIVTFFSELPGKIRNFLTEIINNVIQWGINLFVNAVQWVSNTINNIVLFFSELPYKIWEFLLDIINKAIEWGTNVYNTAIEWVSNTINAVVTFFSELPDKIWEFLVNVISKIVAWGQSAWEKANLYVSSLINSVVNFFSELPGKIWTKLIEIISNIISWGTTMVEKGKTAARELVNTVVNTIAELPNKVQEVGKNIVQGLWNGIIGAKDWLTGKVGEFASGILDGMKSALGIHSPSRVFRDEVGKYIALGVGEGFTDNIAAVYKKMKASVDFETQKISANISATTDLRTAKGNNETITNNNDNGVIVNQNFYEKVKSPYETAKATKNTLRRAAYGI